MTPASHNLGGDTREKLPICERLRVRTRYESGHRPQLVTGSETIVRKQLIAEAADIIEALVEALADTRGCLALLAKSADRPTQDVLSHRIEIIDAALSRARNGGQP